MSGPSTGPADLAERRDDAEPSVLAVPIEPPMSWLSRQVDAMAAAWARGERITADEILSRHPNIPDEAAVRLIYEEVSLRRESGEYVPTTEVLCRFPRWGNELEILLGCDRLLRPVPRLAELPEVGEHLGPFHLRAELGRGASGKTYLASEPALADRPVVLKVISDDQVEHLSLARLQHTNIIPLFSEHSFPDRGLRALCMPYLGGTSLARLLDALSPIPPADRRGRDLLYALDRVQAGKADVAAEGPYRRYFEQASYVHAICYIGTRLADGLHEAHARGIVHMDVKPSNVLIAADGLPLLLDFHLARRPLQPGERFPDRIGGTPGWMAPEHSAALDAVSRGEPVAGPVDHRADIFSLGLLLREALGGKGAGPERTSETPLRRLNPHVSAGLEDIVNKALADRPEGRYPDAASLAEDLRNHLEDLPLRGVPNRLGERWKKWRQRRPSGLRRFVAWASVVLALALFGILVIGVSLDVLEIRADRDEGRRLCSVGSYDKAEYVLRRGRDRAAMLPGLGSLTEQLDHELRVARRGQKAEVLHRLVERIRFRYGIDPPAGSEAAALIRDIRAIWDERRALIPEDPSGLETPLGGQVRDDLCELVCVWAEVRPRLAPPAESAPARDEAIAMLDEAQDAFGPSVAIDRLRRVLTAGPLRDDPKAPAAGGSLSARDHYELGRSFLVSRQYQAAADEFRQSLDRRPQDFWPNFYLGLCEYHLGRYPEALTAFQICVALRPTRAECYFNRGLAADALGQADRVRKDYDHALECDPGLTAALLNRGILHYKSGHPSEAVADLTHALVTTSDPRALGRIQYNLALAYNARGDRSLALASADAAVARGEEEARGLRDRLRDGR